MPRTNLFRHQVYTTTRPTSPHQLVDPGVYPPVNSNEFFQRMRNAGMSLEKAGVAAIYLVHGTFVGADALGVLAELGRVFPAAKQVVQCVIKRFIDRFAGESGNYTGRYAKLFEQAINPSNSVQIPVRRFHWSSENHHIGRADGAVRLIDELSSLDLAPGQRVLLWGHSHAGNLFALMSNLLSGNQKAVEGFFKAAEIYYRWPYVGCVDIPHWARVQNLLEHRSPKLENLTLDVSTFGTPVRYGWDSDGYNRLIHFINHRPHDGIPDYLAVFPPRLHDVFSAVDGDYVQQLGIAGTNVVPSIFSWRSWLADRRLNQLLQPEEILLGNSLDRFRAGKIVPDEGESLLVDYGPAIGSIAQHYAGHAVYTESKWMLFHIEEMIRRFYQNGSVQAA